jgi:hypothetical protein
MNYNSRDTITSGNFTVHLSCGVYNEYDSALNPKDTVAHILKLYRQRGCRVCVRVYILYVRVHVYFHVYVKAQVHELICVHVHLHDHVHVPVHTYGHICLCSYSCSCLLYSMLREIYGEHGPDKGMNATDPSKNFEENRSEEKQIFIEISLIFSSKPRRKLPSKCYTVQPCECTLTGESWFHVRIPLGI